MKTHAQLKAQSLSQPEVKEAYDALAKGNTDLRSEHNLKLYIAGHPTPNPAPTLDHPRPDRLVHGNPARQTWDCYSHGPMNAGIWECQPGAWRIAFADNKQEFFHIIHGRVRLHADNGAISDLGPGDAAIIPPGFNGIFEVVDAVRKHYVIVES